MKVSYKHYTICVDDADGKATLTDERVGHKWEFSSANEAKAFADWNDAIDESEPYC
jgi:hypothetical protein